MNEAFARRIIAPEFQSRVKFGKHSIRQVFIPRFGGESPEPRIRYMFRMTVHLDVALLLASSAD